MSAAARGYRNLRRSGRRELILRQIAHLCLHGADERVRMEAPEIFRVLGKRRPDFVKPYVEKLRLLAGTDENRVVRIHCLGALRAAGLGEAVPAPLGCAEDGRQKTKGHRVS